MTAPIRLAVIGMGKIAHDQHLPAIAATSNFELVATVSRHGESVNGLPFFHEVQQNDVRIVKEKIADYIDDPRVIPLIGPAQLHHAHYKCTIYYSGTIRVGWPIPHTLRDEEAVEVIYVDHNHFHMVGNVDPGTSPNY